MQLTPKTNIEEGQQPDNARKAAPGAGEGREVDHSLEAPDGALQADTWDFPP